MSYIDGFVAAVSMAEDPRMKDMQMPFDGKRMIYGGFEGSLDTGA